MKSLSASLGALLIAGCTFDMGSRMELSDFVRLAADQDAGVKTEAIALQPSQLALYEPYTLGAGDGIEISVTGLTGPGVVTVLPRTVQQDGTVLVPFKRTEVALPAAGLRPDALERAVTAKYSPTFIRNPQVSIKLVQARLTPVLVAGAVTTPGLVNLRRDELNLPAALAKAGWIKDNASGQVTVRPAGGGEAEVFRLWEPADVSRAMARALVPGDSVDVERRPADMAYVMGLVNKPGTVEIPRGTRMSLMQMVAAAGGLKGEVDPREATLVRWMADGKPVRVRVDFDRLMRGTDPDVFVKAGDMLDVYHTDRTRSLEFMQQVLRVVLYAGLNAAL